MLMRKAFTLIELLVAIAIMTFLTLMIIPNLRDARYRARDAKRKEDLKELQKAFELYRLDQLVPTPPYPGRSFTLKLTNNTSDCWSKSGYANTCPINENIYMQHLPEEPMKNQNRYYYYGSNIPDSTSYVLLSCLENDKDNTGVNCSDIYNNYAQYGTDDLTGSGNFWDSCQKCYLLTTP